MLPSSDTRAGTAGFCNHVVGTTSGPPTAGRHTSAAVSVPYFAQAMGLLADPLDSHEVARFLRRCPGLSQTTIGELLGEPSEFWLSVLTHFVDTFDFAGVHVALLTR